MKHLVCQPPFLHIEIDKDGKGGLGETLGKPLHILCEPHVSQEVQNESQSVWG